MLNNQELSQILEQHTGIQQVTLPSVNDASIFWSNLVADIGNMSHSKVRIAARLMEFFSESGDPMEIVNKSGRILKRLAKYAKSNHGYEFTASELGIIGDRLQYYTSKNGFDLFLDFTQTFDWRDGQFGKSGSCYFGCYSDSIPTLANNGAWAVRYYRDMNQSDYNGIGRTWIVIKHNRLYGFNSYGIERPKVSKTIKAIFAGHGVELRYKTVSLSNSQDENIPYINGDSGFVLSQEDDTVEHERIDLNLECVYEDSRECASCDCRIRGDDYHEHDDEYYCNSCFEDRFSSCEMCNEYHENDDINRVEDDRYSYLCDRCVSYLGFRSCYECGEYTRAYTTTEDTCNEYCESCAENHLTTCNECDNYFADSDRVADGLCEDCTPEETEETDESSESTAEASS